MNFIIINGDIMFYHKEKEQILRLGDILKGFILTNSKIKKPVHEMIQSYSYDINVNMPEFVVVLTPCCSIRTQTLLLTSLVQLDHILFKNPYFVEDFIRINRVIEDPQKRFPPIEWENMPDERKTEKLAEGKQYAFYHYFIYKEHDYFTEYSRNDINTQHYMIDFRNIYSITCSDLVVKKTGEIPESIFKTKILQLSIDSRNELRNKLIHFFGRIPDEDKLFLD